MPEEAIRNILNREQEVLVSEEKVWTDEDLKNVRKKVREGIKLTWFICDPMDVSRSLTDLLESECNKSKLVGAVLENATTWWKNKFDGPIVVTGSTTALTCIKDGLPEFSLTFNYLTREVVFASTAGIVKSCVSNNSNSNDLNVLRGKRVDFNPLSNRGSVDESSQRFIAFTGSPAVYLENLIATGLCQQDIQLMKRTGPPRPLYLSDLHTPVGYIVSNGEKIGEWIHWLPYVRFARDSEPILNLYEVMHGQPCKRDGISMAPDFNQSLFKEVNPIKGEYCLACERLLIYKHPGLFRTTLVVAPWDNLWVVKNMASHRHIRFSQDSDTAVP